ncbi:MAG: hypothetical protein QOK10_3776, partial [Pseudonocardiales bacterium]|nr:hypothetical protein [Pseudonocardiales bacterium]
SRPPPLAVFEADPALRGWLYVQIHLTRPDVLGGGLLLNRGLTTIHI